MADPRAHTVVAVTEIRVGTVLARLDNVYEYIVLLDAQGSVTC